MLAGEGQDKDAHVEQWQDSGLRKMPCTSYKSALYYPQKRPTNAIAAVSAHYKADLKHFIVFLITQPGGPSQVLVT